MADDTLRIRLVAWPLLIFVIPILTPSDIGIMVINMEDEMNTTTLSDLSGIRSLAQQDMAGEVDDSFARTGDAEDTIEHWRAAARQANDTDLIALIDRLGVPVAASIYAAARAVAL